MVALKGLQWQSFPVRSYFSKLLSFRSGARLPYLGLALVLALLHLIRFFLASGGELHPDEAYYWAWSQFPALSYYDQGPGIAYYIWLWVSAFGSHYLTLKAAALFASFLTIYMFALASLEAGLNGFRPLLVGITVLFIPGIVGGNSLIMHDSMMILAWSGALWMSLRAIRSRSATSLIGLFLFLGIGGLSKYTMFLFAIGLLIWLISHPSYKEFWIRPASWTGLLLALAIISPIIIWNAENNWDGVGAILYLRSAGGAQKGSVGAYLAGQLIMFSPLWLLAFASLFAVRLKDWVVQLKNKIRMTAEKMGSNSSAMPATGRSKQAAVDFLWIISLVPFLFFLFLATDKEIQANWVFPAYGSSIILLLMYAFPSQNADPSEKAQSDALESQPSGRSAPAPAGRFASWVRLAFLLGWIFTALLDMFFLFSVPLASNTSLETYWIPGYRTAGFKETVQGIEKIHESYPEATLVANRYQDASIAWFYNRGQKYVPSINIMQRNQFSYWPGLEKGKDYLFFHIQENTCEKSVAFLGVILPTFFKEVKTFPEEEVRVNGRVVKRYQVWYAHNYQKSLDETMFHYLRDQAIFQNMPGLQVPRKGEVIKVNESFRKFTELWARIYMSRKGKQDCSIF